MLKFIEQEDVYYPSVLKKIRKSTEQLQPLYVFITIEQPKLIRNIRV